MKSPGSSLCFIALSCGVSLSVYACARVQTWDIQQTMLWLASGDGIWLILSPALEAVCTLSHNLECTLQPVEWATLFLFPWSINGCFQLVSDTSVRHRRDYQICQGPANVWLNVALWLTPRDSSHNHFRWSSGWTSLWGKRLILTQKLFWFIYSDRIQIQFFISCHCKSLFLCLEIEYVYIISLFLSPTTPLWMTWPWYSQSRYMCTEVHVVNSHLTNAQNQNSYDGYLSFFNTSRATLKPQSVSLCHKQEWQVLGENSVGLSFRKLWPLVHISSSVNSNNQ